MMNQIDDLEALPEIDLLAEEGISLEQIQQEMIEDYEYAYEQYTGREMILYPANERRLELNIVAGQVYQMCERMNYFFRRNFIRYMEDGDLENWGANFGYSVPDAKAATVTLEFSVNDPLTFDVTIPAGTRATSGDNVFFETKQTVEILAGEMSVKVMSECSDTGESGNGYAIGQINTIADPVPYVSSVRNVDASQGGADRISGDVLKEQLLLWMSAFSTAGPEGAYIYWIKAYSTDIVDVTAINLQDNDATVNIYILLKDGTLPDQNYLSAVHQYLDDLGNFPDTDKINLYAPEIVYYDLDVTYYISKNLRDNETELREMIEEAIDAYVSYQYSGIGRDIDIGVLVEYARAAGAKRVTVTSPAGYAKTKKSQVVLCRSKSVTYGGLEE